MGEQLIKILLLIALLVAIIYLNLFSVNDFDL